MCDIEQCPYQPEDCPFSCKPSTVDYEQTDLEQIIEESEESLKGD